MKGVIALLRNRRSTIVVILLILTFVLSSTLIAGCGDSGDVENGKLDTKIVVDHLGREVELPANVERVVSTDPICTQMVFALGQQDKLVGCDEKSHIMNDEFLSQIDPGFPEVPSIGSPGEANPETLAFLEPDVILVRSRFTEQLEQLENLGFNVITFDSEDLDLLAESVKIFGQTMDCEERAEEYNAYYRDIREMIAERLSDFPDEDKPKVYLASSMGMLSTTSGDSYQGSIFDLCGGNNVARDVTGGHMVEVSAEQVLAWNPEYVFVVRRFGDEDIPKEIMSDPQFAELQAVKDGRVMWFPSTLSSWDFPSMQAVLGLVWCAKTLHPDKFEDVDVLEYADQYFLKFFGKSFTDLGGSL